MLFPPLSSEDYDRLKQSIAVSGQQVPILVDADTGEIIDGEHRLRACRELGIEPQVIERHLTEEERRTLPVSMNLARRHLTPEQKREFIANLRRQGWTQQEIGEMLGVTRRRIGQMENEILVMEEISITNNATDSHAKAELRVLSAGGTGSWIGMKCWPMLKRCNAWGRRSTTHGGKTWRPRGGAGDKIEARETGRDNPPRLVFRAQISKVPSKALDKKLFSVVYYHRKQ